MKAFIVAIALSSLAPAVAEAQPLEQNFAFGAPLSVLGNDRFRATRAAGVRPPLRRTRSGEVAVRVGQRGPTTRDRRWN